MHDLRHYWLGVTSLTKDHVRTFLDSEGIDQYGLTPHQRKYLKALAAMPKGQCNVERLAVKVGCDLVNVRQEIELYLIEQGYVDPASRLGRAITPKGLDLLDRLPRDADDSEDANDVDHPGG